MAGTKATNNRKPYNGDKRSLVLAFDVGTTFSGVSYAFLEPGEVPKIHGVTRYPGQEHVTGNTKIPSLLYYDREGNVRAAGAEAESAQIDDEAEDLGWSKVELFKLRLRPRRMELDMNGMRLSPLPAGKSSEDVFGDFLHYLFTCTRKFIEDTHANGKKIWRAVEKDIQFVLSHPNGWEGAQQSRMRRSAISGGLIQNTDEGKARIRFVTEGEASMHACILSGLAQDVLSSGNGFIVADAGGGTLDVSSYILQGTHPLRIEEVAPPDCLFSGAVFVSRRCRVFLEEKLRSSKYGSADTLDHITKRFDETTKRLFRDKHDAQYIPFGSPLDKDIKAGIRSGQLRLTGAEVAELFEPSIVAAVNSIKKQVETSRGVVKAVWLVGGFAASPWLFSQLQVRLAPLGVTVNRPDTQTSKAVADGAIAFFCDHHVSARMSRYMYGVEYLREIDVNDQEHVTRSGRQLQLPSGPKYLPDAFDCILAKNVRVKESSVFSRKYYTEVTKLSTLSVFEIEIWCYRNGETIPKWIDRNSENFGSLCFVRADLSKLSNSAEPKHGANGQTYWTVVFSIEIHFGLTEFKARMKWNEDGRTRYGPATIVFNEKGVRSDEDDARSFAGDESAPASPRRPYGSLVSHRTRDLAPKQSLTPSHSTHTRTPSYSRSISQNNAAPPPPAVAASVSRTSSGLTDATSVEVEPVARDPSPPPLARSTASTIKGTTKSRGLTPSFAPSHVASVHNSPNPSQEPPLASPPSERPPSRTPSAVPPSRAPSVSTPFSPVHSRAPSAAAAIPPSVHSRAPSAAHAPSPMHSRAPSAAQVPSVVHSRAPSAARAPSPVHSRAPSAARAPSPVHSHVPSVQRAPSPVQSRAPSAARAPSPVHSRAPSAAPIQSPAHSRAPSVAAAPSHVPSRAPSAAAPAPSPVPSRAPSAAPAQSPVPSRAPSVAAAPSPTPSRAPSVSGKPASVHSRTPSNASLKPTSAAPSRVPSMSRANSSRSAAGSGHNSSMARVEEDVPPASNDFLAPPGQETPGVSPTDTLVATPSPVDVEPSHMPTLTRSLTPALEPEPIIPSQFTDEPPAPPSKHNSNEWVLPSVSELPAETQKPQEKASGWGGGWGFGGSKGFGGIGSLVGGLSSTLGGGAAEQPFIPPAPSATSWGSKEPSAPTPAPVEQETLFAPAISKTNSGRSNASKNGKQKGILKNGSAIAKAEAEAKAKAEAEAKARAEAEERDAREQAERESAERAREQEEKEKWERQQEEARAEEARLADEARQAEETRAREQAEAEERARIQAEDEQRQAFEQAQADAEAKKQMDDQIRAHEETMAAQAEMAAAIQGNAGTGGLGMWDGNGANTNFGGDFGWSGPGANTGAEGGLDAWPGFEANNGAGGDFGMFSGPEGNAEAENHMMPQVTTELNPETGATPETENKNDDEEANANEIAQLEAEVAGAQEKAKRLRDEATKAREFSDSKQPAKKKGKKQKPSPAAVAAAEDADKAEQDANAAEKAAREAADKLAALKPPAPDSAPPMSKVESSADDFFETNVGKKKGKKGKKNIMTFGDDENGNGGDDGWGGGAGGDPLDSI